MPGRLGNQTGRPRGFAGLAAYIKERTNDGRRLADFAIDLLDGKLIDGETVYPAKEPGGEPTVIRYQQTPPPRQGSRPRSGSRTAAGVRRLRSWP
jgi:hypothetical protein